VSQGFLGFLGFLPPPADVPKSRLFRLWGALWAPWVPPWVSAAACRGLGLPFCTFGGPCVDFGQIFGPRTPKMIPSWSPPCAPGLRFSKQILGFPWFRRKTQKVVTLTPRGVQNDPKRHPKLPKASQRDPKVAPRASTGVHFGTLEGSLGPLLALNGSSGAVLGTLWGRLRPHRVHLGYSWRLWAPKSSEKPPF